MNDNDVFILSTMNTVNVRVLDEKRKQISFLKTLDEKISLVTLRELIQTGSYDFVYKNVPISTKQESIVRLMEVARRSETNKNEREIYIRFRLKRPISPKIELTTDSRKQQRLQDEPSEQGKTQAQSQDNCVRVFTKEEIHGTPFISVFEREKRIFWNSLAAKLENHPIYKSWSVQEKHGILDTEWTLKFTELLKLEADKKLVGYVGEDSDKYGRSIAKNIDKLKKSDFERVTCYNRIERLHKVTIKTDEIRKSIENEENQLHELFSKLKLAQSDLALVKCLSQPAFFETETQDVAYDLTSKDDDNFMVKDIDLSEEQVEEIAAQTKAENEITFDN